MSGSIAEKKTRRKLVCKLLRWRKSPIALEDKTKTRKKQINSFVVLIYLIKSIDNTTPSIRQMSDSSDKVTRYWYKETPYISFENIKIIILFFSAMI